MPKLWAETVDSHRHEVRSAILDAVGELVRQRGALAVSMSEVAVQAGIGRATLYKYYPDVEALLHAWHTRHAAHHLATLTDLRDQPGDPWARLLGVLQGYARICQQRLQYAGGDLGALLHRAEHTDHLNSQLLDLLTTLIAEAAHSGAVRNDLEPVELAHYCRRALEAAADVPSEHLDRLVDLVYTGLATPGPAANIRCS